MQHIVFFMVEFLSSDESEDDEEKVALKSLDVRWTVIVSILSRAPSLLYIYISIV